MFQFKFTPVKRNNVIILYDSVDLLYLHSVSTFRFDWQTWTEMEQELYCSHYFTSSCLPLLWLNVLCLSLPASHSVLLANRLPGLFFLKGRGHFFKTEWPSQTAHPRLLSNFPNQTISIVRLQAAQWRPTVQIFSPLLLSVCRNLCHLLSRCFSLSFPSLIDSLCFHFVFSCLTPSSSPYI